MTLCVRKHLRLYLVTDPQLCRGLGLIETVLGAVAGGVTMVQLRDKDATTSMRVEMAMALKQALAGSGVPIVLNDDVDAAIAADVDGLHIGQTDITPSKARALLGADKILGLSCETTKMVQAVDTSIIDYLGLGPVFATKTKTDHKPPIGFRGLARMVDMSPLPTVAIGGLKASHLKDVRACGADGVAVVSAICGQGDPKAAARAFDLSQTEYLI